jgi:hypothetical protein
MTQYDHLWPALREANRGPSHDLTAVIRAGPEAGHLPSPWAVWMLFGLVRHRRRQLWVAEVVVERLGGDLDALATMGAFGHPADSPQSGLVPGITEWEYFFHGKGCCLTHRGSGQTIDVDFFEPTGEYFDVFFYLRYLQSLKAPEPPEARLIALHPSFEPIRLAIGELLGAGMLTPLEGRESYPFRIAEQVLDHEEDIDAFCRSWGQEDRRPWLAALIGDWPSAHEAARLTGEAALIELTASRAAACRALRCQELLAQWSDEDRRGNVLLALDDLDAEALGSRLDRALEGPIGGTTSRAVQVIRRRDDLAWCPAIHSLFHRLDTNGEPPQPYLWAECQRFLLRHGYRPDEMRAALAGAGGIAIGEAAMLAMEHDPGRALPLFRRALRSRIPANRLMAAAVLALIDRPWSRRELLAVLAESRDQEATSECRAALLECHDQEARGAVPRWEEANPHEPTPGPWITIGEMMLESRSPWIRWEMEKLHDRVMIVRGREPDEVIAAHPGALRRLASWFRETFRGSPRAPSSGGKHR